MKWLRRGESKGGVNGNEQMTVQLSVLVRPICTRYEIRIRSCCYYRFLQITRFITSSSSSLRLEYKGPPPKSHHEIGETDPPSGQFKHLEAAR